MRVVFYISGHGFGHATRSFEVIRALHALAPSVHVIVSSAVPEDFARRSLGPDIVVRQAANDVGMIQIDSLAIDEDASARAAAAFYESFDDRIRSEAAWLSSVGADLVIGDVPPLAFAAAARAGLPSVAIANFTWDWIYAVYPAFAQLAPDVVPITREAYAATTLALRMPFPGGFETMPRVRDIPLVARRSRFDRPAARAVLGLSLTRPIVLASFGGHGVNLPFEAVVASSDFQLVLTDYETTGVSDAPADRLTVFHRGALDARGLRYEDVVAAADVVATKPGYGIVSECMANDTALLYTSRGRFAEYDVMVEEMPRVMRTRFIAQERLRAGDWASDVQALLRQPRPAEGIAFDGAEIAAREVFALLER